MHHLFIHYLAPLAEDEKPDISIEITKEDVDRYYSTALGREDLYGIKKPKYESIAACDKICKQFQNYNILMMHGSILDYNENGYMFCGPSGVGKTTRTKLWLDQYPGSYIVNGDKPFIKITEKEALGFGSPWCGKEGWNSNVSVHLRAIFFIERSDLNEIKEMEFSEAFSLLFQQTYVSSDYDEIKKVINILRTLDGKVKFYRFRSSPTKEAIRLAYETARP